MYNPYYYPNNPAPQPQNTQNGMLIATEEDVLKYPIAPGHSVPFKIDGQPLIIEKSMGLSQFDSPKYKRYRLVEEGSSEDKTDYILRSVYEDDRQGIENEIKEIRNNIDEFTAQIYDDINFLKKLASRNKPRRENGNDKHTEVYE